MYTLNFVYNSKQNITGYSNNDFLNSHFTDKGLELSLNNTNLKIPILLIVSNAFGSLPEPSSHSLEFVQ